MLSSNETPSISRKRSAFLDDYLGTRQLVEILPVYTAAISGDVQLFEMLPESLIDPIRTSLQNFQEVLGEPRPKRQNEASNEELQKNLTGLDPEEFLSCYVRSQSDASVSYEDIPGRVREESERWLHELKLCITGERGLFSNEFDLESFIDQFVRSVGGKRVTDILGEKITTENADYFFRDNDVIVELKILQTDFLESNQVKIAKAREEAFKTVKITPEMILGKHSGDPAEVVWAENKVLRDALQRITKTANNQIKNSRHLLGSPKAKGVVLFIVDGFYSVDPFLIIELLHDPITRQFSAVDAIIVLTFRRKVKLNLGDGQYDYFVFEPRYSPGFPEDLPDFINLFGAQWFAYLQALSGKTFEKNVFSYDSRNLRGAKWR